MISLIHELHGVTDKNEINETILLEDDLDITEDDSSELLELIENKFNLSFTGKDGSLREFFDLGENQFLFHGD